MTRFVQFVSILPVNRVPHAILHEVSEKDMPKDFGLDAIYASDRFYVEHEGRRVACRIKIVEKEQEA